eukprot:1366628-Rhodomonas_salina.1
MKTGSGEHPVVLLHSYKQWPTAPSFPRIRVRAVCASKGLPTDVAPRRLPFGGLADPPVRRLVMREFRGAVPCGRRKDSRALSC